MRAPRQKAVRFVVPPPVQPDWRNRLVAHLVRLSPASRRNRFLVAASDAALARHAGATTPDVVIEACIDGETRGLAEILRRGDAAEIALSVEDDWQRRGIGARLFERALAEAGRHGARTVGVYYLRSNVAMGKIAARAGFVQAPDPDPAVIHAHCVPPGTGRSCARLH